MGRTPLSDSDDEKNRAALNTEDVFSASSDRRTGMSALHEAAPHDPGWDEDELFSLVRRAYPYRNLSRETYEAVLEMLSEGIASRRGRYGAYLHRDRINRKLRARRGARLASITSGGAIPETALFTVVAEPEGIVVGDEPKPTPGHIGLPKPPRLPQDYNRASMLMSGAGVLAVRSMQPKIDWL